MKTLLILLLAGGLFAALFLTRPTKADFEKYIREEVKVVNGTPTGGKSISDVVGDKLRTFSADQINKSAAELYLDECTFENRLIWTDVKKNGKPVYRGAVGHWFERGDSSSS
jgi:hypothetical protein